MLEIRELEAQGVSVREIARRTGHDRKTVAKWLRAEDVPRYHPRPPQPSKLDPFKPYLHEQMARGVFNAPRLLRELRCRGYTGGATIVKDYLQPFRPAHGPDATVRFETAPGEQAQVDFARFPYETAGRRRVVYAFAYTLSYSRALYVAFVEHQDLRALLWGHAHAFDALGGVPETILYDNLKPVVLGRGPQGTPIWQPRFADFALLLGFRPRLCRPYRAQTKGRVERAIGYLEDSFWPGVRFTDLADLNRQVWTWCVEVANVRIHGTTHERPADRLPAERLAPIPAHVDLSPFLTVPRKVSRDGFVSVEGSRYGVPWRHAGARVEVATAPDRVEILAAGQRIASHPRVPAGASAVLPEQWAELPQGTARRARRVLGYQLAAPEVPARPLSVYAALAEEP